MTDAGRRPPDPTVTEATRDEIAILRRLMQFYLYDLATLEGGDIGDDGTFGDPARIEACWAGPDRRSFLIRLDRRLAGLALIRRGTYFSGHDATEMSEFFVLGPYRRRGVGHRAAAWLFAAVPGTWEVRELDWNLPAQAFWRAVIGDFTGGRFEEFHASDRGVSFVVQRFVSPVR